MNQPASRTLHDLLAEMTVRHGDQAAVVHAQGTATYADLHRGAARVSSALRHHGVCAGGIVGLLMTNRLEWLEVLFGASESGAVVHAFNTWATTREIDHFLAESRCQVLVTMASLGSRDYLAALRELVPEAWGSPAGRWRSPRYPHLEAIIVLDGPEVTGATDYRAWLGDHSEERSDEANDEPVNLVSAVSTGAVLYTSGSTAKPKAVPLQNYGMVENGFHIGERMSLTCDDRVWLGSPLFWSFGCANALMATFTHGATLVLQEQFRAGEAIDLIESERCTAAYLLPTLTRAIVSDDGFDRKRVQTLRTGVTIGSPEDVRLAADAMAISGICNVYGATETYGNCCVTPTDMDLADRLVCQGPPLPGVELRIVDQASGEIAGSGHVGEIQVRGYTTPGYLGESAPHEDVFTSDGYYRTGDLGFLDDHQCLHYVARHSDMIKTAGINVSPAEVEEFLMSLDGVQQVAVVGSPDPVRGEVVVAFIVPTSGCELTEESVVAACRGGIASYKVPARVVLADALPTTPTGKLHRARVKDLAATAVEATGRRNANA
jgi:fatty-acyl-CoA synthase